MLENCEEKFDDIESVGEFMTHQIIEVNTLCNYNLIYAMEF